MDMRNFFTQLETTLGSGIPISRALHLIAGNLKSWSLVHKVKEMENHITSGTTFSEAMTKVGRPFNRMHISFIKFGEETGCLDRVCGSLARHAEKELNMNRQIVQAILYPAMVFLVALIMIPVFSSIVRQESLNNAVMPAIINVSIYFGVMIGTYFLWGAAGGGMFDTILVNLPFLGQIFVEMALARFTRALSISQFAGVPIIQGVETAISVCGNPWLENKLKHLPKHVGTGKGIALGLESAGVLPGTLREMMSVGEQSGKLPEMLEKTANYYEDEASNKITMIMKIVPVIFFLPVAIYVGFLVIQFYQGIASGVAGN